MTDGLRLNLGCGKFPMKGWVNVDGTRGPGVDHVMNLERIHSWPWDTDSVDEVYASHVIEHIQNPLRMMNQLHRVCKPDARATFLCPYGSSDDAWVNPTHVREMYVGSWAAFGQPFYWREDAAGYGYSGDWVVEEVRLRVKAEDWKLVFRVCDRNQEEALHAMWRRVQSYRNVVSEMVATLRCQKPVRAADRELQEDKTIVFEVLEAMTPWENRVLEVGRLVMGLPK